MIRTPLRLVKRTAKKALGLIPPSQGRLTGKLARDGGSPVRNTALRPWPRYPRGTQWEWTAEVRPVLSRIFRTGAEGLPQPLAREFARKWAEYCEVRHALLLPHGTDALRIGLAAALDHDGLDYGGEVIVPNISFIASVNAALDRRFGVALVDVDPRTLNVDPRRVEEAIVPGRTRAIMAVHLFGQPADMKALREIAQRHALALVEDAAQAHGARHELGRVGSIGDVGAFSFQGFKNLSSGEGGCLTTNSAEIFNRAYSLHNVGRTQTGTQRWGHHTLGWNIRPTEYVAAMLLHRFRHLERRQQTRWERFQKLHALLKEIPCVEALSFGSSIIRHGAHMFVMRYQPEQCGGLDLASFLDALKAEGMPVARAYESTLAQQPAMLKLLEKRPEYVRALPTPVADEAVKNLIFVPQPALLCSERDIEEVAAAFRKVSAHYAPESMQRMGQGMAVSAPELPDAVPGGAQPLNHSAAWQVVSPIRLGIIGAGVMGRQHADAIARAPRWQLQAVADSQPEAAQRFATDRQCRCYGSAQQLIGSGEVDIVVIATPHWQHAEIAAAALRRGLHVLCEKPLSVTVAQADDLLQVAAQSKNLFAVVHQTRFDSTYQYVKKLLESGELGPIYRCSMIETAWRTEAYYRSSPWRGTWKGEGGGVLLNQAPHVLDRYAWLFGMPETVLGICDTTLHQIEVEDTVSGLFRHANGAHGYLHVNTIENPGVSQMTLFCDRGKVLVDGQRVRIIRLKDSLREKTASDMRTSGTIQSESREREIPNGAGLEGLLTAFYDNVASALDRGSALVCPGSEGRNAVELANALILSSAQGSPVRLPLDRQAYADFISRKIGA